MAFLCCSAQAAEISSLKLMCVDEAGEFVQRNPLLDGCGGLSDNFDQVLLVKLVGSANSETLNLSIVSDNSNNSQKIENIFGPGYQFFKFNLCEFDYSAQFTFKVTISKSSRTLKYVTYCGD